MPTAVKITRGTAMALILAGYPLLVFYVNTIAHHKTLAATLTVIPIFALICLSIMRSGKRRLLRRMLLAAAMPAGILALWANWSIVELHSDLIYWMEYSAVQLLLLLTFARSLSAPSEPVCTRLARMMQSEALTSRQLRYTRKVTLAWAICFASLVVLSTLLFMLAPRTSWFFFADLLTLPLIAGMFIVEYIVRHQLFPETRHMPIMDAVRAYSHSSSSAS